MRMTMGKKHILFVVALILLVVSIVYRAFNPFEQARVEALTYTVQKRIPDRSDSLTKNRTHTHPVHDTVSRFIDPTPVSVTIHQDLFAIYQPPRPAPAPETSPAPPQDGIPIQDPEQDRRDLIQDAIREISGYRIFGVFEAGNKMVVFLAKDKQVFVAGKGDFLEEKFRIDEIEKTHITITALPLNESIHLDMSEFYKS
jgi:hypothetical protein